MNIYNRELMVELNLGNLEAEPSPEACVHHWLIDPANGPTSIGICKFCGTKKEFKNSAEDKYVKSVIPKNTQKPK